MKIKNFEIVKNIKILAIAVLFFVGFSLVSSWVGPTSSAPYENIESSLNSSSITQYRTGNLVVKDDPGLDDGTLEGSVSADKITVIGSSYGPSYFFNQFNIGNPYIETGADTDPKLVSEVNSTITFSKLSSSNNVGAAYPAKVCVGSDGQIALCESMETDPEEIYSASNYIKIVGQTFTNVDSVQSLSCPADYPVEINSGVVCSNGSDEIYRNIVNQDIFVDDTNGVIMVGDSSAQGDCTGNNFDIKVWAICAK
jgi:hypothetical protein